MTDMTATGWDPANAVVVLSRSRPWGPNGDRQVVAQLNFTATNFLDGAAVYPSAGVPAPSPSTFGFREYISYIIPMSPFMPALGAAAVSDVAAVLPWGAVVPTYGASGAAPQGTNLIRIFNVRTATSVSAGVGAEPLVGRGTVRLREFVTTTTASDLGVTGLTYTAYAVAVGK